MPSTLTLNVDSANTLLQCLGRNERIDTEKAGVVHVGAYGGLDISGALVPGTQNLRIKVHNTFKGMLLNTFSFMLPTNLKNAISISGREIDTRLSELAPTARQIFETVELTQIQIPGEEQFAATIEFRAKE